MKKKGFTLIELLAVIVILAIIALIATPLVLKYIEYSKEKSAKLSAQTYAETVEKEYVSKLTSGEKIQNKTYTIKELDEIGVKVKGDKPEGENDTVTLQNGKVIKYTLTIKDYVIVYEDGKTTVTPEKDATTGGDLLDHTIKFMSEGELYQLVSVKDGQIVNKPNPDPEPKEGVFTWWTDASGNTVTFPFTPTSDMQINARISATRDHMVYSKAGDVIFTSSKGTITKTNDGDMVCGASLFNGDDMYYYAIAIEPNTQAACSMSSGWSNGTVNYNGMTYQYCISRHLSSGRATYDENKVVYIGGTAFMNETIAKKILDRYYGVS